MKNFIWIVCLMIAISGSSCTEVYFKEPQPIGKRAKKSIPKTFQGMYISDDGEGVPPDTSILGSNFYQQIEYSVSSLRLSEIDSTPSYKLSNGRLYISQEGQPTKSYLYKIEEGKVKYWEREEHYIGLSDTLVYKSYKGYHFLNIKEDKGWIVTLMKKNDVGDVLLHALTKDDIEKIQEMTNAKPIIKSNGKKVDYWILDPSRKELLKIVEAGLFRNEEMVFEQQYRVRD